MTASAPTTSCALIRRYNSAARKCSIEFELGLLNLCGEAGHSAAVRHGLEQLTLVLPEMLNRLLRDVKHPVLCADAIDTELLFLSQSSISRSDA